MPINPEIALQVQHPQFTDPFAQYAKVAGMRNMMQLGQLRQQQIVGAQEALKTHQLANAETERAQGAQRKLAELVSANTTKGENGEPETDHFAVIKGLSDSGNAKEAAAYDTQRRLDLKSKLDNASAQIKNLKEKTGMVSSMLGPLVNGPPDQAAANYPAVRTSAIQNGLIKPQDAPEQYDPNFVNQHYQAAIDADKQADNHLNALKFAQDINEKAPKTYKEWSDLTLNQASAARSQAELDQTRQVLESQHAPKELLAQLPTMWSQAAVDALANKVMTAEQHVQEADKKATREQTALRDANTKSYRQSRLGIEAQNLKLRQQQAGFEQGGGISESARAIAKGDLSPGTTRALLRKNAGLLNQVKTIDPAFDEATIENRYQTLKQFANTGKSSAGGQMDSFNTMIHHADLYLEAADALKNGSFKPGNKIYNEVSSLFGSPAPQNAALVARFLAAETGKVATGGVPAEGEIKGILQSLGTDASPQQISEAGKKLLEIAGGKALPLIERAKKAKVENIVQLLGDDSKEILKRRGFDPETMKPVGDGASGGKQTHGTYDPATGTIVYK